MPRRGKKDHDHEAEHGQRDQRVGNGRHDQNPGRATGLGEQIAFDVKRGQPGLGAFRKEVPEKQADDQIQLVGRIRCEHQREDAHQHHEQADGLEKRPHEATERPVVASLEVGPDERPEQLGPTRRSPGEVLRRYLPSDAARRARFRLMQSSLPGVRGASCWISSHNRNASRASTGSVSAIKASDWRAVTFC